MVKADYLATGRRKKAVARVRLKPGKGKFEINTRPLEEYFTREAHTAVISQPFELVESTGKYDVSVTVRGGGLSSQAGAIRLGISRALVEAFPDLRPVLKKAGYLTRDPRMPERKKFGLRGARRAFQFSKR